ncbi:siderophore ABC transporter substrate-binding protein [Plastorhodobacter daqingensis]|uniref:Siderophore ABC transporter substrate-binding protein n=1 Tax=Plastorhodobacter daqingensis TaxID=1387281 RepID=A0ABW2UM92_9RHOB
MSRITRLSFSAALAAALALPAFAADVTIQTAQGPVTLPQEPRTVAVFDIAAIDTLTALGVQPAGVPDNLYVTYLPEQLRDAAVIGTLFEPNLEALAGLAPDLIIVGGRSAGQAESLSRIAPVIDMTITGDELAQEALARLEAYGTLFAREEAADELARNFNDRLEEIRGLAADEGRALVVMTNGPKISAYGRGSRFGWMHAELGLAEAVDVDQEATHGEAISFEFVREANPDWLIVVDRAAAIGEAESARETLNNALVAETTAWKQGNVVYPNPVNLYIAGGGYNSMMGTMQELLDAFSN